MAKRRGRTQARGRSFAGLFADALEKQRQGRTQEAVALYERAIRIEAGAPEAHNNLGCALLALGRPQDAAAALHRAVGLRPDYAEALDTLGVVVADLGRPAEAVGYFERALAAEPRAALTAFHLGNALLMLERLPEARMAFERALVLEPGFAAARNGLGAAFGRLGDDRAAVEAFRAALALDPAFGDAASNLGRVLLEAGDVDEGRRWFERAIAIDRRNSHYYLELVRSGSKPVRAETLAAMEVLNDPAGGLTRSARIDLHFGLAKAYEDAQRYDDAFRQLVAGNQLKRAELTSDYDETEVLGFYAKLELAIDAPLLEALRSYGNPSDQPIFVFGMPRSGSTLVEQILAAHPAVAAAGETTEFGRLIGDERPPLGIGAPAAAIGPPLRAVADGYLVATARLAGTASRFTDKTLANFSYAPFISAALPNARMIHVRRNWLDTCFSCFATLFLGNHVSFSYEMGELARYYAAYDRLMTAWRTILPAHRLLEVSYEDVVADLETQARRIVAFCGLPWDDACLAFHVARRSVRTASAFQVRQPLYDTSIGRAERFAAHLQPLIDAAAAAGLTVTA